jgi:hypothetical protein
LPRIVSTKPARDILRLGDLGQLDRPLAIAVGEMLERAKGVSGALRKHRCLL